MELNDETSLFPGEEPYTPPPRVRAERNIIPGAFRNYPLYTTYFFTTAQPVPTIFHPSDPYRVTILSYEPTLGTYLVYVNSPPTFRIMDALGNLGLEIATVRHPAVSWPYVLTQLGDPVSTATAASVHTAGPGHVYELPEAWIPIPATPVPGNPDQIVVGGSRNGNQALVATRSLSSFRALTHTDHPDNGTAVNNGRAVNIEARRYPVTMAAARAAGYLDSPPSTADAATIAALRAQIATLQSQLNAIPPPPANTGSGNVATAPPAVTPTTPPRYQALLVYMVNDLPGQSSIRLSNRTLEPTTGVQVTFTLRAGNPSAWAVNVLQSRVPTLSRGGTTPHIFPTLPSDIINFINSLNLPWWIHDA
jgi:hypothetical protein